MTMARGRNKRIDHFSWKIESEGKERRPPGCSSGKEPTCQCRRRKRQDPGSRVRSLDQEDPIEEGMATYSSILGWRIPWTEEPGGLQYRGLQRVGHDGSSFSMHIARGKLIVKRGLYLFLR